jgi:hypothetical protein
MGSFCRRDLMARVEEVLSSMKRAHTPHAAVCGDVLSGSGGLCSDGAIFLRRDRGLVGRRFTYVPSTTYLQPRMLHGMFRGNLLRAFAENIFPLERGERRLRWDYCLCRSIGNQWGTFRIAKLVDFDEWDFCFVSLGIFIYTWL